MWIMNECIYWILNFHGYELKLDVKSLIDVQAASSMISQSLSKKSKLRHYPAVIFGERDSLQKEQGTSAAGTPKAIQLHSHYFFGTFLASTHPY